jgi:isocitrate dehydrogenase kinase/phosphatase
MVIPLAMLAVESGGVVALRMMKLMLGGSDALYEAELMVSEKVNAAFEAAANVMAGASGDDVIRRYRQHVAANAARLAVKR